MARKRHSDEDILKLLREIAVALASGHAVATACRSVGISDATYYNWRKRFGGKAGFVTLTRLLRKNARRRRVSRSSSYGIPPAHRLSSELAQCSA
jgi:putative transposase